ncbi:hypothetical protein ABI59_10695 [Acidobacteria bacterium Mor1]|nr:hypothetical protein ABI59_10695 [Acidobacteria bacterium Mor1]
MSKRLIPLFLITLFLSGAVWAEPDGSSELAMLIPRSAGERAEALQSGLDVERDLGAALLIRGTETALDLLSQRYRIRSLPPTDEIRLHGGRVDFESLRMDLEALEGEALTPVVVALDGPWDPGWIPALENRGAAVSGLVPPYSVLLRATPAQLRAMDSLPFVLSVTPYEPSWRISERALDATSRDTSQVFQILAFPGADLDALQEALDPATLIARGNILDKQYLQARLPGSAILELAQRPEVEWIDLDVPGRSMNEKARVIMQTERTWNSTPPANLAFYNPVYGIGVHGESQIIAVTDEGLNDAHAAFGQSSPAKLEAFYIPANLDPTCGSNPPVQATMTDPMNHGTPVACSVAGNDVGSTNYMSANLYDGIAFRSRIIMQATGGPAGEFCIPDPYIDVIQEPAFQQGAMVHNNSWGHGPLPDIAPGGTQLEGTYSALSQAMDAWLHDPSHAESVQVFAAGNFGALWSNSSVYVAQSLSDEAQAKNVIAVGASKNGDFRHEMYNFSSRGPTDDGRVKPDVVAPGEFLMSADATTSAGYWNQGEGTSFAAPYISGTAALVRDYFEQDVHPDPTDLSIVGPIGSALVKAMLINSSVWLWTQSAYEGCQAPADPQDIYPDDCYPNFDQGYGRPALDNVLEPAGYRELMVWQDRSTKATVGSNWTKTINLKDTWQASCSSLRVTLAWVDPAGQLAAGPKLVNDLDLTVTIKPNSANPTVLLGNERLNGSGNADSSNNVEDVFYAPDPAPAGKKLKIRIDVDGISGPMSPGDDQRFAVVLTYGPCADLTPCFGVGGCYAGPGDTVPGSTPPSGGGGCQGHIYSTDDCGVDCGEDPTPSCNPPQPPIFQPRDPIPFDPIEF